MTDTPTAAPASSETLLQQGLFHHRQGEINLAMDRYTEVLQRDPENADALYYVAVVACQEEQFEQGVALARRAISLGARQARVHNLLGQALDRLGEKREALKSFDAALAIDPDFAVAHGNRANILAEAGLADAALQSFDRALALQPDALPDWINRGSLLVELGRLDEALANFDKAHAIALADTTVMVNRANVLTRLGRLDGALADYDRAVALQPKFAQAHLHRGLVLKYLGRFDEARTAMERAVALDPKAHNAAYTLTQLLLLTGDWSEGLPLLEHRDAMTPPAYLPLDFPRWNGEPPGDYRLVVLSEQGLGDNIQFSRYASLLAGRGHAVTVLTREDLAPLLRSLPGIEAVVTSVNELEGDSRPVRWVPLMSLLALLHLKPNAIPAQAAYLSAEPARIATWAQRLGPQGFKIGIAWQDTNWLSAAPLAAFAPLAEIPGVRLVSLQKQGNEQIGQVAFGARVERLLDGHDFSPQALLDTAALIANLDLVVSIDAMPAHLAGALRRPVFLALHDVADWRWLTNRTDSPWYPRMRLFRQDATRDWTPVFAVIAKAVREMAAGADEGPPS
jgi:tetratricopeptide (TPR) repeat protein